jgi:NTE family protein
MSKANEPSTGPMIALALSGGGARAMAFHLGCMRALHDRGLLQRVVALSTVSGGSVIGACWAYWDGDFDEFDKRMTSLLRRGIQRSILRAALFSVETPKIAATLACNAIPTALIGVIRLGLRLLRGVFGIPIGFVEHRLGQLSRRLPIWGSLSTAFEHALRRRLFGNTKLAAVKRPNLEVVINTCDLRTGTAFRFGSVASGGWRYGRIKNNDINLAKAVASSAAFPLLLPPLVERFEFERDGEIFRSQVVLTDGGVFDNLGTNVLEPDRDAAVSVNIHRISHIICANAGAGQANGDSSPFWWLGRVAQSFETVHRKVQDAAYGRLHRFAVSGALKGFGMIYLGQVDERLPNRPADLVPRESVYQYPTDFAAMTPANMAALTQRGEQLAHAIIDQYLADL